MLRKVYLEGELGEKYGKVAEVKAESVREVMQYLQANHDTINKYLIDSTEQRNIGFTIKIADTYVDDDRELLLPFDKGDIIITPTPMGAKGAVKVIVGVVLVVVGILISPVNPKLGMALISMGANLVLTGIQEMMAPDPSTDEETEEEEGYIFQGAEASIIEGYPVPILYGELRVPGQPITFDVQNTSISLIDRDQNGAGGTIVYGDEEGNYYTDSALFGAA